MLDYEPDVPQDDPGDDDGSFEDSSSTDERNCATAVADPPPSAKRKNNTGKPTNDQTDQGSKSNGTAHTDFQDQSFFGKALRVTDLGSLVCGVVLPTIMIGSYGVACAERIMRMIIKHPVETLLEVGLIVAVPIINFLIWRANSQDDGRFARKRGILNGVAIGSAGVIASLTGVALALGYPVEDSFAGLSYTFAFQAICLVACLSLSASVYMASQMHKMRSFRSSKSRQIFYAITGAVLAALAFVGAEARSIAVRLSEQLAISHNPEDRARGLSLLTQLDASRDLIMEGADPRTAGIPGLFIKIDPESIKPLFFAVTGERYRSETDSNYAVLSGDYLRRHVVGAPVEGLSLLRSSITGNAHPDSLSSSVSWTFVLSNDSAYAQEARAEIGLPTGAVITGLTTWIDGKKQEGAFLPTVNPKELQSGYQGNLVSLGHNEPAIVTDLGRGRYLMHCYPINTHSEVKVQLTVVAPMSMNSTGMETLALPRLISSNFAVRGEHQLTLRSGKESKLEIKNGASRTLSNGENALTRTITDDELTGGSLTVGTKGTTQSFAPLAVVDPYSSNTQWICENIQQIHTPAPRNLIVVLDGSKSVSSQFAQIKEAMKRLPSNINASLLLAAENNKPQAVPLEEGLNKLQASSFKGGQDNLQAVVKAADIAGSDTDGAVLWIHGPQPAYSREIFLMAPFVAKPKVYEMPLDNGESDVREFLRNHDEIGQVASVPRTGSVQNDLERFLTHWHAGDVESATKFSINTTKPDCRIVTGEQAKELAALWANQESNRLLAFGNNYQASQIAVSHKIVSPVSLSGVYQAPSLQGAINGTVGPQGGDATVIQGVNTAGVVRVNNLANLEALLNIIANSVEILGLVLGGATLVGTIFSPAELGSILGVGSYSKSSRLVTGATMIMIGLATPGVINWLVASSRDANLFS